MFMNVYDTVNKLAGEIKASEEYINLKKAKDLINNNVDYKTKISEFEKLRYEEQINTMTSGKSNEDSLKKIQDMYGELISIEEIKNYFDAELKFNILLGDVNKIISEAVKDLL